MDYYDARLRQPLWARILPLVPLAVILGFLLSWYWPFGRSGSVLDPTATPRQIAPREGLLPDELANIDVYEKARRSVVYITTLDYRRDPVSLDLEEVQSGTGSGFIWSEKGYVVTNFHVIQDARAAQVHLFDNRVLQARLVGVAPDKDLAVLKIDDTGGTFQPIAVGTSRDLKVGQRAYAMGNPFGVGMTFTDGVISALDRQMKSVTGRPIEGVLQTTAAINPGNSGGPLLDSSARLIGVNAAIYSPTGAYAGIGFAIPVDTVNQVVPQLIQGGKVDRPGLGVQIASAQIARRLGIKDGVLILEVLPGGAAVKAGLQPTRIDARGRLVQLGDIVVAVDDHAVHSADELFEQLAKSKVGTALKVTVLRDGARQDISVVLQAI